MKLLKSLERGFKELSFNQKTVITISVGGTAAMFLATMLSVVVGTWNAVEARKERIKAEDAKAETLKLAAETADMVALTTTYLGWGINSVPNFQDRNECFHIILSNSVHLIRLTGREPSHFSSIRQLQGVVYYVKGSPGIVNRPSSADLEHLSGMKK